MCQVDSITFRSCISNKRFPDPSPALGMDGNAASACSQAPRRRAAQVSSPKLVPILQVKHRWSWVRHAETVLAELPQGLSLSRLFPIAGRISSGSGCHRSSSLTSTTTSRVRRATAPRWGQPGCASSGCRKVGGQGPVTLLSWGGW